MILITRLSCDTRVHQVYPLNVCIITIVLVHNARESSAISQPAREPPQHLLPLNIYSPSYLANEVQIQQHFHNYKQPHKSQQPPLAVVNVIHLACDTHMCALHLCLLMWHRNRFWHLKRNRTRRNVRGFSQALYRPQRF